MASAPPAPDPPSPAPGLRSLYVCYLSLSDPLVSTQVVAYLEGLVARGHTVHLLTFEPRTLAHAGRVRQHPSGITHHTLRYHKRPSLLATAYDVFAGAAYCAWVMRRHRLDVLHARTHVPAAMGLLVRRLRGSGLIFDIRGLMAEEYIDAGTWRPGSLPVRLTHWVQRRAASAAAGVVVLTERLRHAMFAPGDPRVRAIPCCVDVGAVAARAGARPGVRERLGVGERPVLIYVGKLSRWYRTAETLRFFALARAQLPGLHLLIVSQDPPEQIARELAGAGIAADQCTALRAQPGEVADYLAAADAAILLPGRTTSEISSSPTKIGEYLAAGLPIVWSAGLGDFDALLRAEGEGVEVCAFGDEELVAAAVALRERLGAGPEVADRRRAVALRELDLERVGRARYDELYRYVRAQLAGAAAGDRG